MHAEALLILAVLKMYGKWFGQRTWVGALHWWGERLMFYRGTGGDWLDCAAYLLMIQ